MQDNSIPESGVVAGRAAAGVSRRPRWRWIVAVLMTAGIIVLAYVNRTWLLEAIALARAAQLSWLLAAFATILCGFFVSSQVFQVAFRGLGHQVGVLRLWATAIVAIITSQLLPAGSVGSYAFL